MTLEGNHMRAVPWLLIILSTLCLGAAQQRTYTAKYLTDFPGPQVYKDTVTGALLYVESDGRHVAAISRDGKLLWSRDPFKDAHLEFYRTEKPQIVYIGKASKAGIAAAEKPEKFVGISFNNSQFGYMRISDGEFYYVGQD
jgi:hypothetical protein